MPLVQLSAFTSAPVWSMLMLSLGGFALRGNKRSTVKHVQSITSSMFPFQFKMLTCFNNAENTFFLHEWVTQNQRVIYSFIWNREKIIFAGLGFFLQVGCVFPFSHTYKWKRTQPTHTKDKQCASKHLQPLFSVQACILATSWSTSTSHQTVSNLPYNSENLCNHSLTTSFVCGIK